MHFKPISLTTALRPELVPDEALLFVQDAVGLYEGKFKIPQYQEGHAYLTSLRICYVDDKDPRALCVSIELQDVERFEFQAGFLKASSKIALYAKPIKAPPGSFQPSYTAQSLPTGRAANSVRNYESTETFGLSSATWVCPICSFANPIPSNFEPRNPGSLTSVPSCLNCGIAPPAATILKAAVSSASRRSEPQAVAMDLAPSPAARALPPDHEWESSRSRNDRISCPRCTFSNDASLRSCEICGAQLPHKNGQFTSVESFSHARLDSPGPFLDQHQPAFGESLESIKLSFRGGGEKIFYERLKGAMIQKKWLLRNAPPVPKPSQNLLGTTSLDSAGPYSQTLPARPFAVGIAGLERRGLEARQNNEKVIGSAFGDLEALMTSAKEVLQLAETFAESTGRSPHDSSDVQTTLSDSAAALGMVTTKDILSGSDTLYLSELSRNLAEYLTDDRKGVLHREGGIMTLVDLWAIFNRSRNGVELVSPTDFQRAAELWEKLKLPVRLRRFKSGLLAVQRSDWTDEKTIRSLETWLWEVRQKPPAEKVPWDWTRFGRGITAQEAAQRFGWSVGVATEELEMAEDSGVLCREEGIEGLRFWSNSLMTQDLNGD